MVAFLVVVGSAQAASVTLHLRFSRAGKAVGVMTDGRYTLIERSGGGRPTLLDERTHKRVMLPACSAPRINGVLSSGFEGPYFEWRDCAASTSTLDLYTLATGTISKLAIAKVPSCQDPTDPCTESVGPAGTDWYVVHEYFARCNCSGATLVNRQTGQEAGPAGPVPGPIDLNSPAPAHATCPPLARSNDVRNLLFGGDYGYTGSGLTADVQFQNSGAPLGGFAVNPAAYDNHLLRCNSTLNRRVYGDNFTGNQRALLIYNYGDTELHGLFLPSLRRFVIALPTPLRTDLRRHFPMIVLTNHTLWAVTSSHQLWTAPAPAPPK